MKLFTKLIGTAAIGVTMSLGAPAAFAETPPNMLVMAMRIDDITTADPAQSFEFTGMEMTRNIYGKLVNYDPLNLDAGYQPDLATEWDVSEDGKTISFTMREGVTFHSGNPVTAEDAAYSLRRVIKLNKTPAFILTQFGFTPENVDEMIRVEDGKLLITTDRKYATSFVLNCLTAGVGAIVDMKTVEANAVDGDMGNTWLATNTAGSGPYKLVSWKPNESYMLEANPDYYGGAPAMQRVVTRHVQESASQRLLLEAGDIDVARNLNPEDVKAVDGNGDLDVYSALSGQVMYFAMGQKQPQFSNPKVVEAVKYLIDYHAMADSFLAGEWAVHQNFLPATYMGSVDENPFKFDVEKAKALLDEAGVGPFEFEVGVREAQDRIEMAQSIQNTLAEVGITMNITLGTAKQILTRYRARDLDAYLGAWGPDYPDPQTNAGTFAWNPDNSDEAKATGILAWRNSWNPGELTQIVDDAKVEPDTSKRAAMYEEIQAISRATSPIAVMFQRTERSGVASNLKNWNLGGAVSEAGYFVVTKE
ncbi:ABC transporter substrate-binding protein [Ruegeria sp.]|uniref:ABC transporter substrate-binding protein n=1 Tax=Ruegeria sp. TaxID=1879320 RepID=UPI003C7CCE76